MATTQKMLDVSAMGAKSKEELLGLASDVGLNDTTASCSKNTGVEPCGHSKTEFLTGCQPGIAKFTSEHQRWLY